MARYEITAPDGSKYEITAPDQASEQEVMAYAQSQFKPQAPSPEKFDPTGSAQENIAAGFGRAFVRGGRAIKGAMDVPAQFLERQFDPRGTLARATGLPTAAASAAQTKADLLEAEELDKPLLATTGGKVGDLAGNLAMFAPTVAIPGANTVTGAGLIGAAISALTTPGDLAERGKAGAFGAAGGAGGQKLGQIAGNWAANRTAERAANAVRAAEQGAVRDATLRASADAGYVVPPSTSNPTAINRLLESVSGKAATQQSASIRNQQVTNRLAREALELPVNAPLTLRTLQGIRSDAGKVYEQVASAGRMQTDDVFRNDLLRLSQEADRINIDFPDLPVAGKDEIVKLTNSLSRDSFDAKSAIAVVKSLRNDGHKNMSGLVAAANPNAAALGRAQLAAAEAVEDQLMRHLAAQGKGELAAAFDKARVSIAKSYSVQNALNTDTGNVIASNLAKQSKKGKPLSDGLDKAASFAGAFPKAAAEVKDSGPVSALEALASAGMGSLVHPGLFAWPLARMGTRGALLSGPGQRMLTPPNYAPGLLGNIGLDATGYAGRAGLPLGLLGSTAAR